MADPDFEVSPEAGHATRLNIPCRDKPWHIRIGEYDLYVHCQCAKGKEPSDTDGKNDDHVSPEFRAP